MFKRTLKRVLPFALALMLVIALAVPAFAATGVADSTYYNTGCLTATEKNGTSGLVKGDVVVMYPTNNRFYTGEAAKQLVISGEVDIICIAGVGSSSAGTAAFAKHIAKIKNQPVAGIVSGYGDASIYVEGTQGYFIGRTSNVAGTCYVEPASRTLIDLYEAGARPSLLVGHSKGNMDMANALYRLYYDGHAAWYGNATFKTFGCGVNVPDGLANFRQYIGTLDTLGYTNTVSWKNMTYVYGRYHTTNPYYAFTYMPIQNYL